MSSDSVHLNANDPLMRAVHANDVSALQQGLRDRFEAQTPPNVLIAEAVAKGYAQSLDVLLAAGARTGIMGVFFGGTPLHSAASNGHDAIVRRLLDHGVPVDQKDAMGLTPLSDAVRNGHVQIVQLLLAEGADWRRAVRRQESSTSLRHAQSQVDSAVMVAVKNDHPDVVVVLVNHGAARDEPADARGDTLMHLATRKGWVEVVEALAAQGLTLDPVNMRGATPLWEAVDKGKRACVKALVEHGACPYGPTYLGETPMELARRVDPLMVGVLEIPELRRSLNNAVVVPSSLRRRL